jgi:hypothetical protein
MANLRSLRAGSDSHWPPRGTPHRGTPQLPAFCRTRRPTTVVSVTSLRAIHRLLLLVLLFQLSTLLLVIAGPLPPKLTSAPATTQVVHAAVLPVPHQGMRDLSHPAP